MVINNVSTTLKNQITISFQNAILISVAKIHGTNAEKKMMAETLTTPTMNFVLSAAFATSNDGKNISIIDIADALASNAWSGVGNI